MDKFDLVTQQYENIPYMKHEQAVILRDLIHKEGAKDILEIGFYQGKSSAYIAAVLEDQGDGSLTTLDRKSAKRHDPNIEKLLQDIGLMHRVTPIYCHRSYTWELQKLLNTPNRPQFDFCYFDGGHTWDSTGFGVLLVDMLLRPGGVLLLDDMDWSIERSPHHRKNPKLGAKYSAGERTAKPVRLVWDTILPHLGYSHIREYKAQRWGTARKPLNAEQASEAAAGKGGRSLFSLRTD